MRCGVLPAFAALSLLIHLLVFMGVTGWVWQPPQYDIALDEMVTAIDLVESPEPPLVPETLEPEPEEVQPLEPEPEPEPVPEPEPPDEQIPPDEPEKPEPPPPVETEPPPPSASVVEQPPVIQPVYLRNPAPPYPAEARLRKWEGTVLIRLEINAEGKVTNAMIAQSSGHPILDMAALQTLRRWRFSPARFAGQTVSATVDVPITFALRDHVTR